MRFLKEPYLPYSKVTTIACDSRVDVSIIRELKALGVEPILVPQDVNLQIPVSAHADLHIFNSSYACFYTSKKMGMALNKYLVKSKNIVDCEIINNTIITDELGEKYPNDVLLNGVVVGKYLICNPASILAKIMDDGVKLGKTIIPVKQGYTKCSVAVVDSNAIITDDPSVYNATKDKMDVLYIDHGVVQLRGYDYGFIGGSCGKLAKDVLAFCGNLTSSKCCDNIRSFCNNFGVQCISLSKYPLYDYGSLIPILEKSSS